MRREKPITDLTGEADAPPATRPADVPHQRRGFGIAARMYGSLVALTAMAVAAAVVALLAFDRIEASVNEVTGQAVPEMVDALELARLSAEISAIAPGFAAATTQAAREQQATLLAERQREIAAAVEQMATRGLDAETTGFLSDIAGRLATELDTLDDAVAARVDAATLRSTELEALSSDLAAFEESLETLVDDSVFHLVIGGEQVSNESAEAITTLVDGGVGIVDRLLTINAEGNLAFSLLTQAVHLDNATLIPPLRERYTAAAAAIERNLGQVADQVPAGSFGNAVARLLAFGIGPDDVFTLRDLDLRLGSDPSGDWRLVQQRLDDAHESFLLELAPLVDDAAFDLVMATEAAAAGSSAAIADLVGVGADALYLLLLAQAEGNLAAGLMNQAAITDDVRLLIPLRERFDAAALHIADALDQPALEPVQASVAAVSTPLLAHADGDNGLFSLREREVSYVAEAELALAASQGLSFELGTLVAGLVDRARQTSSAAAARADGTIDNGQATLVAIAAAVVLGAIFVMLVYVRHQIIRPLGQITVAMHQLADGDTTVDIPCRDRQDEMGRMAAALGVFRDTALEVQRSNLRELQTARRRLADAIESISEAFSLYDADGRLIICNSKYRSLLYPGIEDEITPGVTFEQIIRQATERGYILDAVDREEEWIADRIARHDAPGEPHIQQRFDGRWIMVSEHKTGEGGTVAVYSDITELKEREAALADKSQALEQLSNQLAKYLAPQVYESIFTGRQEVKLTSRRKKLTVFFSDIVNFTGTADRMESEDLTQLLNHYLTEMSEIALEHGATIDKYVGDAIVIFFGDPESRGTREDALACVRMAVAMQRRMHELMSIWREAGIETPLRCRMGINTGFCTVGNFGSEHRMDYTIIGGGVNLASRLETAAEPDQILISYETYALVREEIACEERGQINVKGFSRPVTTYAVVEGNLTQEVRRMDEQHPHLRLALDPEAMDPEERREMEGVLRRALRMIAHEETEQD